MNQKQDHSRSRHLAINLNNSGVALHNLRDYEEADYFYCTALRTLKASVESSPDDDRCASNIDELVHQRELHSATSQPLPIDIDKAFTMAYAAEIAAVVLYNKALLHLQQGELSESAQLFEMNISLLEIDGGISRTNFAFCAVMHKSLASMRYQQGCHVEAISLLLKAHELGAKKLGSTPVVASTLTNLGEILMTRGLFHEAITAYEEASRMLNQYAVDAVIGGRGGVVDVAPAA